MPPTEVEPPILSIRASDPQERLNAKEKTAQEPIKISERKPDRTRRHEPKREPSRPRVNLETRIAGTLMQLNFFILLSPFRKDALSPEEIQALAHAINAQAQTSKKFQQAVEIALGVASSGELLGVVMVIGMRRAINHDLIPEQYAPIIEGLINAPTPEDTDLQDNQA